MGLSIYTSPDPEALENSIVDEILQHSYSGFGRWRASLAEAAGIGTRDGAFGPEPDIDYSRFESDNYYGTWADGTEPEDPLYLLFVHSDCEGMIPHKYLAALADRLEEILPYFPDPDDEMLYVLSHRVVTERFISGLREADALGYGLVFS